MSIADNLTLLKNNIHTLAIKYNRDPNAITLLAASKSQSVEKIREAHQAGQNIFGENYLQEALQKISALNKENVTWHFIGNIQSNKTKLIAENFSWVQSVHDLKHAISLNQHRPENLPPLNVCLQINISKENSKSGLFSQEEAFKLANEIAHLKKLKLRGLMTIPTIKHSLLEQRAELKKLHTIFENLQQSGLELDTLSMGMSEDLEAAIAEGATMVRIGTAIFGPRQ